MDAKQFLAEFGHIANAPGGVQRLREMIYQLAITGLLSQQTENAESLLQKIELERERLIKKGEYKRILKLENEPLLTPVVDIPQSWAWTRLLDIGEVSPKNKLDDEDGKIADFISMSGISESHQAVLVSEIRPWNEIKKGYTHFANNDVAVAKITPCFENGKAAVIRGLKSELGIGAGTTELHVVRLIHEGVLPDYVYIFLRSPYFKVEGEKNMTGTAGQKRLPTEFFATYPFPLPPTEEQSRIVAKVDELMALCDKLEAKQQKKRKLQNQLRQSVLQAVANAESPKELQDSWERLAGNFSHLFADTEDVGALRGIITDLAIRGLLVKQEINNKVASLLLQEINDFRESLINQKRTKHPSSLPKISEDKTPFALPYGWVWIYLGDLMPQYQNGLSKRESSTGSEVIVIRLADVVNAKLSFSKTRTIRLTTEERDKYSLVEKDILITRVNGSIDLVGSFVYVSGLENGITYCDHFIRMRFPHNLINQRYIHLLSKSKLIREQVEDRFITTAGQKTVNQTHINTLILPLPPLEEQKKIVDCVDTFVQFCNTLEEKLRSAQKTAERLAAAAIASLTGIFTPQQEDPMKVPKTELKAPVRLGTTQPPSNTQAPLASLLTRHNGEMGANDLWQRFGGEVDAFYAQLKTEVMHGWIAEPTGAQMLEKEPD